jgi:DsbC/DsbD-like thiol-disulfide interchange protein
LGEVTMKQLLRRYVSVEPRRTVFNRASQLLAVVLTLPTMTVVPAAAQSRLDPVQWSLEFKSDSVRPGGEVLATLAATIQSGWHLYSLTTPRGGPNATTVTLLKNPAVAAIKVFQPAPIRAFDPSFNLDTETFEKDFLLLMQITTRPNAVPGPVDVEVQIRYQACQDTLCLPPRSKAAKATVRIDPSAKREPVKVSAGYAEVVSH